MAGAVYGGTIANDAISELEALRWFTVEEKQCVDPRDHPRELAYLWDASRSSAVYSPHRSAYVNERSGVRRPCAIPAFPRPPSPMPEQDRDWD